MIWKLVMPPPWMLFVNVEVHDSKLDFRSEEDEKEEENFWLWHDEHTQAIYAVNKELNERMQDLSFFSKTSLGQTQLERFGFHSSHPPPELRRSEEWLKWEHYRAYAAVKRTARIKDLEEVYKVPVLLHVCCESRTLLQSLGYGLAFSTYTSPASIWFNYSQDILILSHLHNVGDDGIPEGGSFNLGQCPPNELERVRRLALERWHGDPYYPNSGYIDYLRYGDPLPSSIHEIVQLCGKLEDLLIVENNWYLTGYYGNVLDTEGDCIALDIGLEEIWGHYFGWTPTRNCDQDEFRQLTHGWDSKILRETAHNFEIQLRDHSPFVHPMSKHLTPSTKFKLLTMIHLSE